MVEECSGVKLLAHSGEEAEPGKTAKVKRARTRHGNQGHAFVPPMNAPRS